MSIKIHLLDVHKRTLQIKSADLGCVSLGKSESGFLIQDHSDHGASKEPKNPYPERSPSHYPRVTA